MAVLQGLKPATVFHYFEEICGIPHGSGHTDQICEYLVNFARERNLEYYRDDSNNVVIYKPASAGYENAPVTILQGHCDMVTEKTPDSCHDFETEGLRLSIQGDFITAENTTLGGDDGIAVAYMLAVLDDQSLKHPALEMVITADEEIGLLGAKALDPSVLKGRYLINMDSEEEGYLWTSCAGGLSGISRIPMEYAEGSGWKLRLEIHGLTGGHSGVEIHKNRANANKLMGRLLYELGERWEFSLAALEGGTKENAITRSTRAVLLADKEDVQAICRYAGTYQEVLRKEYSGTDQGITVTAVEEGAANQRVLTRVSQEKAVFFLMHIPYGVEKMSGEIEGLVETSNNIGVLKLEEDQLTAVCGVRSAIQSARDHMSGKICYLTEFLGGSYQEEGVYPAWEYKKDSPLRDRMTAVYREMFHQEPKVKAIHAGLECGLFYDKLPGLDCISFGPTMLDVHTTEERLSISSAARMWDYLVKTLESIR